MPEANAKPACREAAVCSGTSPAASTHLGSQQAALRLGNSFRMLRPLTVQLPSERLASTRRISLLAGRLLQGALQLRPSSGQLLYPPLQRRDRAGLLCCVLCRSRLSIGQLGSQGRLHSLGSRGGSLQLGLQLLAPSLPLLLALRHVTQRRWCCWVGGSRGRRQTWDGNVACNRAQCK